MTDLAFADTAGLCLFSFVEVWVCPCVTESERERVGQVGHTWEIASRDS